jgi:hypothetical protein
MSDDVKNLENRVKELNETITEKIAKVKLAIEEHRHQQRTRAESQTPTR